MSVVITTFLILCILYILSVIISSFYFKYGFVNSLSTIEILTRKLNEL